MSVNEIDVSFIEGTPKYQLNNGKIRIYDYDYINIGSIIIEVNIQSIIDNTNNFTNGFITVKNSINNSITT